MPFLCMVGSSLRRSFGKISFLARALGGLSWIIRLVTRLQFLARTGINWVYYLPDIYAQRICVIQFTKNWLKNLLLKERSVSKLAASVCLGTFIALSPTIPVQTPLAIALCWALGLNIAVAVPVLYLVNNPLTLIPIYAAGYALGVWFFKWIVRIDDIESYNPWWVAKFNAYISQYIDMEKYLGSEFCFWCLIVGGFLFATLVTIPLYPLMKRLLAPLAAQLDTMKDDQ